jgi:hypothetical protein
MQTKALTWTVGEYYRLAACQGLIRDEEAAGSNPLTQIAAFPTGSTHPWQSRGGKREKACTAS